MYQLFSRWLPSYSMYWIVHFFTHWFKITLLSNTEFLGAYGPLSQLSSLSCWFTFVHSLTLHYINYFRYKIVLKYIRVIPLFILLQNFSCYFGFFIFPYELKISLITWKRVLLIWLLEWLINLGETDIFVILT